MAFSQFHFAQSVWLWGLLGIPVVPLLYSLLYRAQGTELLKRFADRHLLPHLVKSRETSARKELSACRFFAVERNGVGVRRGGHGGTSLELRR